MHEPKAPGTVTYTSETPSLAEALYLFEALPSETPGRKARARSAVATMGRLSGKAAEEIPAVSRFLRNEFSRLKNRPTGLSPKTIANCKSELRYLMQKSGVARALPASRPLSEEWAHLRDAFNRQPLLWKLSRFFAFCSAQEIRPEQVTDDSVAAFEVALAESDDVVDPRRLARVTIRDWNKLAAIGAAGVGSMPSLTLPAQRTKRWTVEPSQFPISFQNDVSVWLERLTVVDPEAEEGPIRALRPATLTGLRYLVSRAASALVFSGRPIESVASLACLVEMEAFKTILRHLRERQGGQPTPALYRVAITLKSIARHVVGVSDEQLKRMGRICANYNVEGGTRSRDRLQSFEDERLLGALLKLPERFLEEAADPKTPAKCVKTMAQMAVALEIEFHTPLRLSNLVALNLQDIQSVVIKGETRWIIRFDRDDTKNHSRLTYELPAAAVKRIQQALVFYKQTNGHLFPGANGLHKTAGFLGDQVKREVEKRIPAAFNIHLMRGVVATMLIREDDNGFEMARVMLGDRSDKVVRKHYTGTADQHLIRKAQATIQSVRVRTAPIAQVPTVRKSVTTG